MQEEEMNVGFDSLQLADQTKLTLCAVWVYIYIYIHIQICRRRR